MIVHIASDTPTFIFLRGHDPAEKSGPLLLGLLTIKHLLAKRSICLSKFGSALLDQGLKFVAIAVQFLFDLFGLGEIAGDLCISDEEAFVEDRRHNAASEEP